MLGELFFTGILTGHCFLHPFHQSRCLEFSTRDMRKVFKVLEIEAMKELKTPMANKITTEAKAPQSQRAGFWETMTKTISIKTVTTYMCIYIYTYIST